MGNWEDATEPTLRIYWIMLQENLRMHRKNGVLQGNRDQKCIDNRDINVFKLLLPMIFLIKTAIILVIGLLMIENLRIIRQTSVIYRN